jgi:hypothetical protein
MAYERFANGGLSSLAAGINDSVTSLTVKSAAGFPTGGNFRILVESEIMLVTAVQGETFTVTRAQEGTSAASHSADVAVNHVLTAGALAQREIDQFATGALASRDAAGQAGRLYLPTEGYVHQDNGSLWDMLPLSKVTPPASADFTWVNQGTSTVTDTKGMMVLNTPSSASADSLRCLVKSAPATPYTITVGFLAQNPIYTSSYYTPQFGVCWRESSSGKLLTYGWGSNNYPLYFLYAWWTNETTLSGGQFGGSSPNGFGAPSIAPYWVRFGDDGTYRTVEVSSDGFNWVPVQPPQRRTVFCTPNQVGVFANSWKTSQGIQRVVSVLHWRES